MQAGDRMGQRNQQRRKCPNATTADHLSHGQELMRYQAGTSEICPVYTLGN